MHEKLEFDLIAESRCGDRSAMTELFSRHYAGSVRMARRILRSDEDSKDAVQMAYFSAYRHFSSFRDEASFKTWITRIVVNQCLVYFRRPERRFRWVWLDDVEGSGPSVTLIGHVPSPEDLASSSETAAAFVRAMGKLPPHMREVLNLCTVSGLSTADAAEALGLSIPATKTRLFRARLKMQALLQATRTGQRQARNATSRVQ